MQISRHIVNGPKSDN